jgi:hypothetical protein
MHRALFLLSILVFPFMISRPVSALTAIQAIDDRTVSAHIRIRIPVERQWLGREVIDDLEQCWKFIDRSLGGKLPARIVIDVSWDEETTSSTPADGRIVIGMNQRAAADMKAFFLRSAAREMVRMGLQAVNGWVVQREESAFLVEGMAEILGREALGSARALNGAWPAAQMLDRMGLLGFSIQSSWSEFSGGRHDVRTSAPGITFLLACREMYGRDRTMKLFETVNTRSLAYNLGETFKTTAAELESAWLRKVRTYKMRDDVPGTPEVEAFKFERMITVPDVAKPGTILQLRFFMRKGKSALAPEWLFVQDSSSGRVYGGQPSREKGTDYVLVELPVAPSCPAGRHTFYLLVVDEEGGVYRSEGSYTVARGMPEN